MNQVRDPQPGRRRPIPILTYHQVAPPPGRKVPYRHLVTSPEDFARQMGMLHAWGYKGLAMVDLEPYLRGEKVGKVVGITFDDGYRNCFEHALPVLRYYGFSSTCYMVSGQVGGSNVWDLGNGVPEEPLMHARELKAWVASGQEIGSHTRCHVRLLHSDDVTARREIAGSKQDLESLLGVEVRHFCYPYGGHGPEHAAMAREAGYHSATTTVERRACLHDDPFRLPRRTMHASTGRAGLASRVYLGLEWLARPARRTDAIAVAPAAGPELPLAG